MTSILESAGLAAGASPGVRPAMSADGRVLVRVVDDKVYVRDLSTGSERTISARAGAALAGKDLYGADLSADGQWLAAIAASGGVESLALINLATGAARLVPVRVGTRDVDDFVSAPSISGNGRFIAVSTASSDIYVVDTADGSVRTVGLDAALTSPRFGARPELSDDGSALLFDSVTRGVVSGGSTLMVQRLATGERIVVNGAADVAGLDKTVLGGALSADGRYVVFHSDMAKLEGDTNGVRDVYLNDLQTGQLTRVSTSAFASGQPAISANGRYITYTSVGDDIVPGGTLGHAALYRKDMQTGEVTMLSAPGTELTEISIASISSDGTRVAYLQGERDAVNDKPLQQWVSRQGETGGSAADLFVARPGDQQLQGGAGIDTVVYHGTRGQYTVSRTAVADSIATRDGSDTLAGIERLRFSDTDVALDIDGVGGQAYRVYQAAFNRTPDAAGLGYWIAQMDKGASLQLVAGQFTTSAEFIALYGASPSNAQIVDKLYMNVLHRPGEAAGVAYWNSVLDNNPGSLPQVLASFSESAENVAALVGVMQNGVPYVPFG